MEVSRNHQLPENVLGEKIEANYINGILSILYQKMSRRNWFRRSL